MKRNGGESFARVKSPSRTMLRAMRAADKNIIPDFMTCEVLERFGLLSSKKDGLELADRFAGANLLEVPSAFLVLRRTKELVRITNEYTANPAQEAIAHTMGVVVTRQYYRERKFCNDVADIAAVSTRTDILPLAIRAVAQPDVDMSRLSEVPGFLESWGELEANGGFPPGSECGPGCDFHS